MKAQEIGVFIKTICPNFEEKLKGKIDKSDLTDREKRVLNLRLFDGKTLSEVGKELGVTRERIRQIESKAYRKMRHPMFQLSVIDDLDYLQKHETFKRYRAAFYDSVFDKDEELKEQDIEAEREKTLEDIHLSELELTVRSFNHLSRAGIKNLKDLSGYSIQDLKSVRYLGKKSLEEIIEKTDAIPGFEFAGQ